MDSMKESNIPIININDIHSLVCESVEKVLTELAKPSNNELYHFTTRSGAINMINNNYIMLTTPISRSSTDAKINARFNKYNSLSLTTDGGILTSPYPNQNNGKKEKLTACIAFNINALERGKYQLENVDYPRAVADELITAIRNNINTTSRPFQIKLAYFINRGLKADFSNKEKVCYDIDKLAKQCNQKEIRIVSNKTHIDNLEKYVDFIDFLADEQLSVNEIFRDINKSEINPGWYDKIRVFNTKEDFDAKTNYITLDSANEFSSDENTQDTRITETVLDYLGLIFYVVTYNNNGILSMQQKAKQLMKNNFSLNVVVDPVKAHGKDYYSVKLDEAILEKMESIFIENSNIVDTKELCAKSMDVFKNIINSLSKNRNLLLPVVEIYYDYLNRYTNAVKKRVKKAESDISSVNWDNIGDVLYISRKYTYVFIKLFKDAKLGTQIIKDFTTCIRLLSENSTENNINLIDLFRRLRKKMKNLISAFIRAYGQEMYHIDEIIRFKMALKRFKKTLLSDITIKKASSNAGDLAQLYNSAEVANTENNLE